MNALPQRKKTVRLIGVLTLCVLFNLTLYLTNRAHSDFQDLLGHWRICAYTLRGFDPFPLIGQAAPLAEIGEIPRMFATVPWACVFGNLFYAGFLPYEYAQMYVTALHVVILTVTIFAVYRKCTPAAGSRRRILVPLVFLSNLAFYRSLRLGNLAAPVCFFVVLAILYAEEKPVLSGVLMGLALLKPQIAGIVCVALLLQRRFKLLGAAALVVLLGWAATCALTATPPLTLLREALAGADGQPMRYLGLLTGLPLRAAHVLILNAVLGAAYVCVLHLRFGRKSAAEARLAVLGAACVASAFWSYKGGVCDFTMLIFPALLFARLANEAKTAGLFFERLAVLVWLNVSTGLGLPLAAQIANGFLLALAGLLLCAGCAKTTEGTQDTRRIQSSV
jgi:hypothetical protein